MLECRRNGSHLVVLRVPGRPLHRIGLGFARIVVARSIGAPAALAPGRLPALAVTAYLLPLVIAAAVGSVARAAPEPLLTGATVAVALGLVGYAIHRRCDRLLRARRLVLRHGASETVLHAGSALATRVLLVWPHLAAALSGPDPRRLLERALFELVRLLSAVEENRDRLAAYDRALRAVAPGTYLRLELCRQRSDAHAALRRSEQHVALCLADLRRLCDACEEYRRCQRYAAGEPGAGTVPEVAVLAARAESVLHAYRELLARSTR